MEKVWIVRLEHEIKLFKKEQDAQKAYQDELKRIKEHTPNESNHWKYSIYRIEDSDMKYAIVFTELGFSKHSFVISYGEQKVE